MGLCGSYNCGCGVTSTPAVVGAVNGFLPTIDVAGSGEPGDPFDLLMNAGWVESVADFINNIKAARVDTSQTCTSGSFVDLATVGPQVSCKTGASALVFLQTTHNNTTLNAADVMGVAVSGATTLAAADANSIYEPELYIAGSGVMAGFVVLTGLTPGVNVFTAKYRVTAITGTFFNRMIAVVPLL